MANLYAGTSGFAYAAWKPGFYPAKLASKQFLNHYASRLNCVEINYTFRRLPSASTLENWVAATPPGFVFAVKANQRITHIARLKNAGEATELFFRMIDPLRAARRLGPVLFQLPPQLEVRCVAAARLPGAAAGRAAVCLRIPQRIVAGRSGLRRVARAQYFALRGGIGDG